MINTIFFGSSPYSVIILKKLIRLRKYPLITIVTKPDKPIGRHQTITPNPVAQFALDHQIPLLQPSSFNHQFIRQYQDLKPGLVLVVAYGPPFFTPKMINIPKYKIVNIHPSALPKYRGATPGPWQIINKEKKSAVTFFQIDPLPDHGPVISQIPFTISPADTADSFYQKAFTLSASKLNSTLSDYIKKPNKLFPQNHSQKSYFPKFTKDNAQINWKWPIAKIERFTRALNPWPIAWTYVQNQKGHQLKMKILSSSVKNKLFIPGSVQIEGKPKTYWDQIKNYYQILKSKN